MADCIGTDFPQFPCALVQMRYSIAQEKKPERVVCDTGKERSSFRERERIIFFSDALILKPQK